MASTPDGFMNMAVQAHPSLLLVTAGMEKHKVCKKMEKSTLPEPFEWSNIFYWKSWHVYKYVFSSSFKCYMFYNFGSHINKMTEQNIIFHTFTAKDEKDKHKKRC